MPTYAPTRIKSWPEPTPLTFVAVVEAGADSARLNFSPKSPRYGRSAPSRGSAPRSCHVCGRRVACFVEHLTDRFVPLPTAAACAPCNGSSSARARREHGPVRAVARPSY